MYWFLIFVSLPELHLARYLVRWVKMDVSIEINVSLPEVKMQLFRCESSSNCAILPAQSSVLFWVFFSSLPKQSKKNYEARQWLHCQVFYFYTVQLHSHSMIPHLYHSLALGNSREIFAYWPILLQKVMDGDLPPHPQCLNHSLLNNSHQLCS